MEKAVIVGVFEFLGFHFCKRILDEGIEVVGIQPDIDEDNYLIEEKRLEIGRNANFSYINSMDKWNVSNEPVTLIVDFYDFFVKKNEGFILNSTLFEKMAEKMNQENSKVIFLIPILLKSRAQYKQGYLKLMEKVEQLQGKNIPIQTFYLPTIYGPWQSEEFLFQQAMSLEEEQWQLNDREWTGDALYVEDIVADILNIIEKNNESFLLKSGETDAWSKCAKYLNITLSPTSEEKLDFHDNEIIVGTSSLEEGLEKQKRLVRSLKLQ